jgi:hypothetical protein
MAIGIYERCTGINWQRYAEVLGMTATGNLHCSVIIHVDTLSLCQFFAWDSQL